MDLTPLESRSAPVGFELVFEASSWFTPERRRVITSAFAQWAALAVDDWTARVWVSTEPLINAGALAEAGPAEPGGWVVRIDPARVTDDTLAAVALHEAGHVVGLGHQPADTPAEWRGVMFPYLDAAKTTLTGLEARDLLRAGHEIPPGTVLTGVGTTPGGWMVYSGQELGWPRGQGG